MINYQPMPPEHLFAQLKEALHGIKEQKMPSLRIAHDVERREFELNYAGGTTDLTTPDGSPVHPGIRHIASFWVKMLKLPCSPASLEKLHARLVPSDKPRLTLSPIYLLTTVTAMLGRPTHFDWPEDQSTVAWLKVAFEHVDGEAAAYPEITLDYEEGLRDHRADLEVLLDRTSRYWSHFCGFAAPWFVDSGVTHLEMVVPIMEPDHPYFGGQAS